MKSSEQLDQLFTALAKAQKTIEGAIKDSTNPHFKSKYADLASVMQACKSPLSDNGLSVMQIPDSDDPGVVAVTTVLGHTSGQWISSRLVMLPSKVDPQGVGSAITYARRYSLAAMVGVCPEDDDGNAASAPSEPSILGPLVKALEANDAWEVLAVAQNQEAFRQAFSRLNTKQKAQCRELEQQAAAHCHEYAEGFAEYCRNNDDLGAQQFIADLTHETAKRLVWARLDGPTRHWLKELKG